MKDKKTIPQARCEQSSNLKVQSLPPSFFNNHRLFEFSHKNRHHPAKRAETARPQSNTGLVLLKLLCDSQNTLHCQMECVSFFLEELLSATNNTLSVDTKSAELHGRLHLRANMLYHVF